MSKKNIAKIGLIILILLPAFGWAQSISGKFLDQDKNPLEYVAVAVLNPVDSILISYANTDENGAFELKQIKEGKVIFQAHLIGFKTHQKIIDFKNESIPMGNIVLEFENELDEVVVTAIVPITIKTDTIAFNTKAFKIRVEDTVEDLLKKLPGVEVDASGKVTAQGEEITKIYVDGKEFFSGDPAIATKNLSADAIKSIEVIDEKSEKARVSGVNDLERKKVINLKLKDDKKVNDFGKVQGGYGTDDRYLTSLNYNRFSSKFQTSVIGKLNNVNTSGSDISEVISFNGGRGGSSNSNSGFLTTGVAGLNTGYEFKKDQNLNADYFYNYSNRTSGDVYRNRTEFIGDAEIKSNSYSRTENENNNNKANFSYRDRSSKLKSISIRGGGNISRNNGQSASTLDKYNAQDELDLQSLGNSHSRSDNSAGNISLDYTKRFNELSKRNISFEVDYSGSKSESISNNNQINKFNLSDPLNTFNSVQDIDKEQSTDRSDINLELEYTEPITENHLVEFSSEFSVNSRDNDVNQTGTENDLITEVIYNEYYENKEISGRIRYKYDNEKFSLSTGAKIIEQTQDFGLENDPLNIYNNTYTNINPELSIRYNKERGEFFRFSTRKRVNLPSSSQISPAINDFNPLFIRQGNPNLTPEEDYSIYGLYGKHNFASGFSLFTRITYNYKTNSIGNSEFTDQYGIRYSSYENLGDRNNFSGFFHFGNTISSIGLRYRVRVGANYSEYFSMINNIINETQTKTGNLGVSLENNTKDKVDASIGASWNKNYTKFTSGRNADREYFQQSYYTKVDWNVSDRFNVNSQFKYDLYTDSNFGTDQAVPIWNATLSYALTKSRDLTVLLSALDILNKNIGLERNSNDNYFEEVNREVLGNYYMLSLSYNLNGNKGAKKFGSSEGRRKYHSR